MMRLCCILHAYLTGCQKSVPGTSEHQRRSMSPVSTRSMLQEMLVFPRKIMELPGHKIRINENDLSPVSKTPGHEEIIFITADCPTFTSIFHIAYLNCKS